jgi:hypothetical protein
MPKAKNIKNRKTSPVETGAWGYDFMDEEDQELALIGDPLTNAIEENKNLNLFQVSSSNAPAVEKKQKEKQ